MLSQRRTRSISTSRTPSLPASSLRPSSRAQPEAARPSSARPCAAEDAGLDQNARRNLYMKYSYVPSWVFLAKRHENLFSKVIDYFFKHNAWPDFHKLPEAFRFHEKGKVPSSEFAATIDGSGGRLWFTGEDSKTAI